MDTGRQSFEITPPPLDWPREDPLKTLRALRQELSGKGRQIFDLSMLNPDLPPPRLLLDKLLEASLNPANHRYAISRGIRKLREAFAEKYKSRFAVSLDPESEVCVTLGTKDALFQALRLLKAKASHLVLGAPAYPAHWAAARLAGFECSTFDIGGDEQRMAESLVSRLAQRPGQVVLLNFPNNPTGRVVSRDFYRSLLPAARKYGAFVINDFVYGEMGFAADDPPSLLSVEGFRSLSAETYSLSKAYSVPGWRVGALVGNAELVHGVSRLKSHVDYGLFLPVQMAAAAALTSRQELVRSIVDSYKQRCRLVYAGLKRLGWQVEMPAAGASVWVRMPEALQQKLRLGMPESESLSVKLAGLLLLHTGMVVMPGCLFGRSFDGFLRLAMVLPAEDLREVLRRLGDFMGNNLQAFSQCCVEARAGGVE